MGGDTAGLGVGVKPTLIWMKGESQQGKHSSLISTSPLAICLHRRTLLWGWDIIKAYQITPPIPLDTSALSIALLTNLPRCLQMFFWYYFRASLWERSRSFTIPALFLVDLSPSHPVWLCGSLRVYCLPSLIGSTCLCVPWISWFISLCWMGERISECLPLAVAVTRVGDRQTTGIGDRQNKRHLRNLYLVIKW